MIDLLISPCGQLLTFAGPEPPPRRGLQMSDAGLVEHGALGINLETGTIEYAGPQDNIDQRQITSSCPIVDASQCVVMPGFVDSHTHLVFAGSRADEFYRRSRGETYQEITQAGGGITQTMERTREADPFLLEKLAHKRLLRLYDNGTTTVEIKSGYGLTPKSELTSLEVINKLRTKVPGLVFATYLGAHLVPPEYQENRGAYVDQVINTLIEAEERGLADFYDIFVDPLAFNIAEAERIVSAGKKTTLGLRLHADEFGDDGTSAWGALHGALAVEHLGGIGPEGIEALAASDTVATLLPATMFFSGYGSYAPARELIEAGCAVALATDLNPGSSLVYSMPLVMTFAVLNMQMTAEECLVASTINAAYALGVSDLVGSLEPGKRADIIIADVEHYNEIPYHVGCDLIRDVFVRGRAIKRQGALSLPNP